MAQFLRESLLVRDNVGRYGCLTVLYRTEISCIVSYVATGLLLLLLSFVLFFFSFFFLRIALRV